MSPNLGIENVFFSSISGNFCVSKTVCCGNGVMEMMDSNLCCPPNFRLVLYVISIKVLFGDTLGRRRCCLAWKSTSTGQDVQKQWETGVNPVWPVPPEKWLFPNGIEACLQSIQSVRRNTCKYVLAALDHFKRCPWRKHFQSGIKKLQQSLGN